MAAIKALEEADVDCLVSLYTDSTYLQKGITEWVTSWKKNNWITSSKKPVSNKDLWMKIDRLNNKLNIKWIWIRISLMILKTHITIIWQIN